MSLCVLFSEQQSQVSCNEFVHFPWKWTQLSPFSHNQIMASKMVNLHWAVTIIKGLLSNMVERKINVLKWHLWTEKFLSRGIHNMRSSWFKIQPYIQVHNPWGACSRQEDTDIHRLMLFMIHNERISQNINLGPVPGWNDSSKKKTCILFTPALNSYYYCKWYLSFLFLGGT